MAGPQRQGEAEPHHILGRPHMPGQPQITPNRMLVRVIGRQAFGQGQVAVFPGPVKADLAGAADQKSPEGAFGQTLQIYDEIVWLAAQKVHQVPELLPGNLPFCCPAPGCQPRPAPGNQEMVQGRMAGQDRGGGLLHQPGNFGGRIRGADGLQDGQGLNNVAQGTQFDEENADRHRRLPFFGGRHILEDPGGSIRQVGGNIVRFHQPVALIICQFTPAIAGQDQNPLGADIGCQLQVFEPVTHDIGAAEIDT